jgi:pre-mRNA-processing factor 40
MAPPAPPCAASPAPPPPPPPPPPAVDDVRASLVHVDTGTDEQDEEDEDEEQREFMLHALAVVGDWSAHDDGDGRLFYYNRRARTSQWSPPEGFSGLEGELMMKLMLESAVARSGPWTAHATGDGSSVLYYFNVKTRASVWERPSDWGVLPPPPPPVELQRQAPEVQTETKDDKAHGQEEAIKAADASGSKKKDKKKKKKKSKKKEREPTEEVSGDLEQQARAEEASKPEEVEKEEEEEEEDPEELEAAKQREEAHMRQIAQFRGMLREKNIMPFCRWSVALPQIAGDPRFMGISTYVAPALCMLLTVAFGDRS